MRYKIFVIILFSIASSQSLFHRFLGADSFSGSARSTAMGKTHLLNAIGLELQNQNNIMFISAERFMYHFIKSIKKNDMVNFKDFFRKSSVFIIDDIQFMRGKESLQEEFFHTFNSLIEKGSQIIISADRPPLKLDRMQERIKSRFLGGLIVDIDTPDVELKAKIINHRIESTQSQFNRSCRRSAKWC